MSDEINVPDVVRRLLAEHGTTEATVNALLAEVEADMALYKAVVGGHMRMLCTSVVGAVVRKDRQATVKAANLTGSTDVALWSKAVAEGLMDHFRIPGGPYLGDALRGDLLKGASDYDKSIGDMLVKAKWFRLLAKQLPDDVTPVRQALTEPKVKALKEQARRIESNAEAA